MENTPFTYQYSAARAKEVEHIRQKYLPRQEGKLEQLRRLDRRVRNAGTVEGLTVGIIGCLVFGIGLCFGLDVLAGADWLAGLFAVLGVLIMIPAFPLYKTVSERTRARLAPEILRLSEDLIHPHSSSNKGE